MFQSGRSIEAVESATPENVIFSQLMAKAYSESPPPLELMEEILATYASRYANELDVKYWTIRLDYMQGDYEGVLAFVEQDGQPLQSDAEHGWELDDLVLYSHLHLGQYEAARELADRIFTVSYDPLRRAVVAAAQGDVDETRLLLAGCIEFGYLSWQFYDYEFLNEALRSDEFASLRELYPLPEPAKAIE